MRRTESRPCDCGSGLPSSWTYDARGIEVGRTCPRCEERIVARFRTDIFSDGSYEADEDIDPDDYGFGLLEDEP